MDTTNSSANCVYTVLVGGYETLQEQPSALTSGVPFICFTDDRNLRSSTWEIRQIDSIFPSDPIRSSRHAKIKPHLYLGAFDASLYIDNTVRLKVAPEAIFSEFGSASFYAMSHSFRDDVVSEFIAVSELGFDDQTRIFEQLNHYYLDFEEELAERPYWGGFLIRKHKTQELIRFSEIWSSHVLRYSRRDQLSMNVAAKLSGITINRLELDNHESSVHVWSSSNRDRNKGVRAVRNSLMPVKARIQQLEKQLSKEQKSSKSPATPAKISLKSGGSPHEVAPLMQFTHELKEPIDHCRLGSLEFRGSNSLGAPIEFAKDVVIAKCVAAGHESAEREFSLSVDGRPEPVCVMSAPIAEGETSMFVLVKINGSDVLRRIVLNIGPDGSATLQVRLEE